MFLSRKWKPYAKKHPLSSIMGTSAQSVFTVPWDGTIPEMQQSITWNEHVLLKSLSHADFPCLFSAAASPLNSLTLLLLTSINRRALQDCIAKGWDLQGSPSLSSILLRDAEKYNKILQQPFKYWSSRDAISFSGDSWTPVLVSSPELHLALQPWGSCRYHHAVAAGSVPHTDHPRRATEPLQQVWLFGSPSDSRVTLCRACMLHQHIPWQFQIVK